MTFAANLNRICKEQGTTLTALVKKMNLSTSKVSRWNEGALPKQDVMVALAKELHCSVMDFFADDESIQTNTDNPLDDDERELVRIFRSLDRRAKHEFMSTVYDFEKQIISEGDKEQAGGSAV